MNCLLGVEEVAKQLSVSSWLIYKKAQANKIPHIRIGRTIRFRQEDIDKWIQNHMKGSIRV